MLRKLEEKRLIAMCICSDNREAFSRLVELHQQSLRRFLLNLCNGNVMQADDLAQETFIKAWLGIRKFRGLSGFRTWLYRIAVNEFVSFKRLNSNMVMQQSCESDNIPLSSNDNGHARAEAHIDATVLLQQLSETERTIALLFYLEELPLKEIVKITGISEGTVKSHLSRARKKLAVIE